MTDSSKNDVKPLQKQKQSSSSSQQIVPKEKGQFQDSYANQTRRQMSFRQNFSVKDNTKGGNKIGLENIDYQDAINALAYGMEGFKFSSNGKQRHVSFFYLLETDLSIFQWFSAKKKFTEARMKVSEIKDMYTRPKLGEIENVDPTLFLCLQIEGGKEFTMQFDSRKQRDLLWKGLIFMKEYSRDLENTGQNMKQTTLIIKSDYLFRVGKNETWVESLLLGVEVDKKKKITEKEVKKLLRKLLIQIRSDELEERMKKYYKNNEKNVLYSEFLELAISLIDKQEVFPLFQKYCVNSKMILFKDIQKFYQVEQGESFDEKQILSKINKFFKGPEKKIMNPLTFSQLLFTSENSIYDPAKTNSQPNLDKPLSDYFVSSSFKSYCLYDTQYLLKEPAKSYISLIQKGARHFDLFCIDGEAGEPQVMQGSSQTVGVAFVEIIKAIKQYGFERNVSPIILNIEHECSLPQQEKIAEILVKILDDMLYKLPEEFISFSFLPSPNMIKRKVLLKMRGKLSNIISTFEKRVAKIVKEREEKEKIEKERREKAEEDRRKQLREQERKKLEKKQNQEDKQYEHQEEEDEDDDPNNAYKGIRFGNRSEEEDEEGEYDEEDSEKKKKKLQKSKAQASNQQKGVNKVNNSGNNKTSASIQSNNNNKLTKSSSKLNKQVTGNENQIARLPTSGSNPAVNLNFPVYQLQTIIKREPNSIEKLIDLEMNLDKEFINDDSYASIKTTQVNNFQIQSNKQFITTNREVKTMIVQQQNSQYSLAENPREAMQRKMRTDQNFQLFEPKSPSAQSIHSSKHNRQINFLFHLNNYLHFAVFRRQSLKQLPHLDILFKSDVPIQEFHYSQSNLSNKEDLDSPMFQKFPQNDKKRNSLMYRPKHNSQIENNLPLANVLNQFNFQSNDTSIKEGGQTNDPSESSKKERNEEVRNIQDEARKIQAQADETFMPIQNGGYNESSSRMILNQDYPLMNNNVMLTSINAQDKFLLNQKSKKQPKNKNIINISNFIEKMTSLFSCKYNQQKDLSIWSCSQLSDQKIETMTQVSNVPDEIAAASEAIIESAKLYLIRSYPKQSKSEFSNYNFLEAFLVGCQLVGINFSTNDIFLLIYLQFFKQNGNTGYVLKPNWLLSNSSTIIQYFEKEAQRPKVWVKVEIISAQSLRVPGDEEKKVNPFILIKLVGTKIDNASNENIFSSGDSVQGGSFSQCFNPQYENFIADFTVHVPDLSFIIFQVFDGKEGIDCFAQYAVPVSCMRKGFRIIPLLDQQFNLIPNSYLFAHVSIEMLQQQPNQKQKGIAQPNERDKQVQPQSEQQIQSTLPPVNSKQASVKDKSPSQKKVEKSPQLNVKVGQTKQQQTSQK